MKIPGPDHPITVSPHAGRVRVIFNGQEVADTDQALALVEASYRPVYYIPREHADMRFFERTAHSTHCPYKGDASYFTLQVGDKTAENAVWSYEEPYPALAAIRGYLAFYPNKVDRIEESDA